MTDIADLQALLDRATNGDGLADSVSAALDLANMSPTLAAEVIRLTAERDAAVATNAALMVRLEEARAVLHNLCEERGDDVLATVRAKWAAARAWLAGKP